MKSAPKMTNNDNTKEIIINWTLPVLINKLDISMLETFCVINFVTFGKNTLEMAVEKDQNIFVILIATENIATELVPDNEPKTNCPVLQ